MTLRKPNVNAEPVQVRSLLQVCQQRRNLYKYSNAHHKEYTQIILNANRTKVNKINVINAYL